MNSKPPRVLGLIVDVRHSYCCCCCCWCSFANVLLPSLSQIDISVTLLVFIFHIFVLILEFILETSDILLFVSGPDFFKLSFKCVHTLVKTERDFLLRLFNRIFRFVNSKASQMQKYIQMFKTMLMFFSCDFSYYKGLLS